MNAGKCILVGTFDEGKGHTSAACNNVVSEVAKHLLSSTWPTAAVPLKNESSAASGAATWMPYIETMLIGKGNISHALICSKTDGTLWAWGRNNNGSGNWWGGNSGSHDFRGSLGNSIKMRFRNDANRIISNFGNFGNRHGMNFGNSRW